jgi:hypothetical protein
VNRLRDFFGAIGDRVMVDGGDLARRAAGAPRAALERAKRPFQRVAWSFQEHLIWPVQDRLPRPARPGRLLAAGAFAAAVGIGVAGALLLASGGSGVATSTEATVAAAPAPKPEPVRSQPKPDPAPTLQGAAPVFKVPKKDSDPAATAPKPEQPAPSSPSSAAASSSPATDKISSAPAAASAQASSAAPAPAGPAAIAVAHEFADAFVVYETGGVEPAVRDAFGKTASERLSKALLRRPPRLPANVEVPKAKVVNVVAAPSRGPVYPVSVSLVRLGVTSELRLSMEQRKDEEWRVTDVLG